MINKYLQYSSIMSKLKGSYRQEEPVSAKVSEREFLTPTEAAELLRCGRTKIYEILGSGSLVSYRVGKKRIVKRAEVLRWIAEQRYEPGED